MLRHLLVGFLCLASCACVSAETLTNGLSIRSASSVMRDAGYVETGLDMMPRAGEDVHYWTVGDGVLIARSSKTSGKIVGLTFWFADERPKATRRTFELDVASFDTSTGTMTIRTRKGEQGAARNSRRAGQLTGP